MTKTGKPRLKWNAVAKRWFVQCDGKTSPTLFAKALRWAHK